MSRRASERRWPGCRDTRAGQRSPGRRDTRAGPRRHPSRPALPGPETPRRCASPRATLQLPGPESCRFPPYGRLPTTPRGPRETGRGRQLVFLEAPSAPRPAGLPRRAPGRQGVVHISERCTPAPAELRWAGRTDATVWAAWSRQRGVRHLRHAPRQLAAAQRPTPKAMPGENRPLVQDEPPRGSRGPPAQLLPADLRGGTPAQLLPANLHGGAPRRGEGPALERCLGPARRATRNRHRQLLQKSRLWTGPRRRRRPRAHANCGFSESAAPYRPRLSTPSTLGVEIRSQLPEMHHPVVRVAPRNRSPVSPTPDAKRHNVLP